MRNINTEPLLVYFSSVTENTKKFVEKTAFENMRIPLHWDASNPFISPRPFILVCPSYGGGAENKAVPKQVVKFLNIEENRSKCLGIISAGNTNFYDHYQIGGRILSAKLKVPILYMFELMGTEEDVEKVNTHLPDFYTSSVAKLPRNTTD